MIKFNKILKYNINFPTPCNISYWWNFGSLLSLFFLIQFISGLLLSIHYCPNIYMAFSSIIHMIQNVNFGWIFRNIHTNGASMFFIFLYFHISRNIYYQSFKMIYTWNIGITIFIFCMITAFLGYILPWGQMSFWGATVITNLISTIPFIGKNIIEWIWGGFSINNSTLNRFFSFHFILPFIMIMLIFIHIYFLHMKGSSNPLGTKSNLNKIPFNFYFIIKDLFMFNLILLIFFILIFQYPYFLMDSINFSPANPLITPTHIQPEWYFLFAYTILRSIPNKLGGVLALFMSILILYFLPMTKFSKINSYYFYYFNQLLFWMFLNLFILLTWLGTQPIEFPFMFLSQILSTLYFLFFPIKIIFVLSWDKIIFK